MRVVYYSPEQRELAFEWVDHWFRLGALFFDMLFTEEGKLQVTPPTPYQEVTYQCLRDWFMKHEASFYPPWRDYFNCLRYSSFMDSGYTEDVIGENAHGEELFAFHYRPLNLYQLAKKLELQADTTSWHPDRKCAGDFIKELVYFDYLVVQFFKWIDHQVENSLTPDHVCLS